jgi:hypothetical protein
MKISRDYLKPQKRDPHLHSPDHVLADELLNKLGDSRKRFGFYLKAATKHNHSFLRKLAAEVLEGNAKNPGALFAFLIQKHNQELKAKNDTEDNKST